MGCGSAYGTITGMKRRSMAGGGYTILEVIIVLAVTSSLFVMTVFALSGKQAQNEAPGHPWP